MPDLPGPVPHYAWRLASAADADAIGNLIAACNEADVALDPDAPPRIASGAVAHGPDGQMAAAGWTERRGKRLHVQGWVHPAHRRRSLGGALLQWQIACSRAMADAGDVLRIDRGLRDGDHGLPAAAVALYEDAGLRFNYIEQEMHRDLEARVPDIAGPPKLRIVPWTPALGNAARGAYYDAFQERGGTRYTSAEWPSVFFTQEGFSADASFIALRGNVVAGFVFSLVEAGDGWIDSVGVRPAYRQQGAGSALVVAAMRAFRAMDLSRAVLRVNADNKRASRVYRGLGFVTAMRHVSYVAAARA